MREDDLLREMHRALLECIETLPEAQAEVLRLRLVEDLPYERVAALLDLDETYARTVFRRARQRVAACLSRRGFD